MATVYVSIGQAGMTTSAGGVSVWRGSIASETITSSGTAASGSLTAQPGQVAKVTCATAVYAAVKGTASATNGVYIAAGGVEYLGMDAGDSVSVIDV